MERVAWTQVEDAVIGHIKGVPHLLAMAALVVPPIAWLSISAAVGSDWGWWAPAGTVLWMLYVLVRCTYATLSSRWVEFTPRGFGLRSAARFWRRLLLW